jgi:hypothetical protein
MGEPPVTKTISKIVIFIIFLLTSCGEMPATTPAPTIEPPLPYLSGYHRVVYIANGNVWVWRDDNRENKQLSYTGDATAVTISRSGELVVFLTNGELNYVFVDPTNGGRTEPRVLVSKNYLTSLLPPGYSDYHIHQFDISPNSKEIYFSITINSGSGGNDLFMITTDTLVPINVLPPGQGGNFHFSPDGKCMAIARSNELLLRCNNETPTSIFKFPPACGFGTDNGPEIVWKSDSSGFYIVTPSFANDQLASVLASQNFYFVPVSGQPQHLVTFMSWLFDPTYISPDGRYVAYTFDRGDIINLHIIKVDTRYDQAYLSFPRTDIGIYGWSPDTVSPSMVIWLTNESIPRLARPNQPFVGTCRVYLT